MNAKIEQSTGSTVDTLKLILALALVLGGVVGFYWFADVSAAYRGLALLAVIALAILVASFTALGRRGREFLTESQFEIRKVVWPTRQETIQTTIVILVVVIILSIILWLIDMFLGWVILEKLMKSGG